MARTASRPAAPRALTDPRRLAGTVIVLLALALGWTSFGPAFLGGPMSMVIVSGNSMDPTMEDGDLAVVRARSSYAVGDIVAFRSGPEDDGDFVIHRIVGGSETDGFVMQGDNNDWLDPWEPTAGDIVGQLLWHVPGGGVWLGRIRGLLMTPLAMASLVGAAAVMFEPATRRRRRRRAPRDRGQDQPMPTRADNSDRPRRTTRTSLGGRERTIVATGVVSALVVAVAAPLAWSAWRTPTTVDAIVSGGTATTELELSYTARASAPSAVYPEGQVGPVTAPDPADMAAAVAEAEAPSPPAEDPVLAAVEPPQPLFTQLIPRIDVHVAYTLGTDADTTDLQGTYAADLLVRSSEGWSTTVRAVAPRAFEGTEVGFDVPVVFERVVAHLAAYAAATGVSVDDYTVTVVPRVSVEGMLAGAALEDEAVLELPFDVGTNQIVPGGQLRATGSVDATERGPAPVTMAAYGVETTVSQARLVATAGILVGLAVVAAAAAAIARRRPHLRHRARHGSLLVDVAPQVHDGGRPLRVTGMDQLAKLARHDGRVILHQESAEGDRYFVPDGELTYEYVEPAQDRLTGGGAATSRLVHVQSIEELTSHWLDPRSAAGAAIVREESPDGGLRCTLDTGEAVYVLELPAAGADAVRRSGDADAGTAGSNGRVTTARGGR